MPLDGIENAQAGVRSIGPGKHDLDDLLIGPSAVKGEQPADERLGHTGREQVILVLALVTAVRLFALLSKDPVETARSNRALDATATTRRSFRETGMPASWKRYAAVRW